MKKLTIFLAFLLFVAFQAAAQVQISGTVTGADDGLSIPGVSIVVKDNPTIGTTTDIDGKYSLTVPSETQALVFSFVGMLKQEVAINGRTVIDVQLEEEVLAMDEVIVVAYGVKKKEAVSGAVDVVKAERLQEIPATSFDKTLQGNISGLQTVSSSGQPGSVAEVRIRGIGSFSAGNEPLYIVDGVPVITGDLAQQASTTNALASLNPNDIESVSVLKDATATSLYGSRASNGVILITTKSGKKGDTEITFSSQYGISSKTTNNFEVLNADEYRMLEYEAYINRGDSPADAYNAAYDPLDTEHYDTDWVKEAFLDDAVTQNYELKASGGNEETQFYLSGSYFDQEGIALGSGMTRYSGRLNLDHKMGNKVKLGTKITGSYTNQTTPMTDAAYFASPVVGAYLLPPTIAARNEDGTPNFDFATMGGTNFVGIIEYNDYVAHSTRLLNSTYLQYDILENLFFKTNLGIDYYNIDEQYYDDPRSPGNTAEGIGRSSESFTTQTHLISTNILMWNETFADVHNVDILLGQEAQKEIFKQAYVASENFPSYKLRQLSAGSTPVTATGSASDATLMSYFTQLNYNLNNKYYLTGSFRRDGSSRFGADHKWANFWSVGGSWRITEENFMSGIDILTSLKLRASYGTSGNSDIDDFASRGLYAFGTSPDGLVDYNYYGQPGSGPYQIANPDLRWEQNENMNIGFDFIIMSTINGSFEYYQINTSDLLMNVPVSTTSGFEESLQNIGAMKNQGFEFTISADVLRTAGLQGDFQWFLDFNITSNNNEITELYAGEDIIDGTKIRREGEPYQTFYMQEWAGVNPANGMPLWYDEDG
ncbi:MAG: SusC/RagA family TonB-linked outer membrane protein, partial [Bacteroidales bacterium]|nr:SusC/RagA family TonB-linked outer membrane protein [Bacteroidales bacterium]